MADLGTYSIQEYVRGNDVYGSPPQSAWNEVNNPSCEVDVANWAGWKGASSQALTRITSDQFIGSACVEHNFTSDGTGPTLYASATKPLNPSMWGKQAFVRMCVKFTSGGTVPSGANVAWLRLRWNKADGSFGGAVDPTFGGTGYLSSPASDTWYTLYASIAIPTGAGTLQAEFAWNATSATAYVVRADCAQITLNPAGIPPYIDGSRPGCGWEGTANASRSYWTGVVVNHVNDPLATASTSWTLPTNSVQQADATSPTGNALVVNPTPTNSNDTSIAPVGFGTFAKGYAAMPGETWTLGAWCWANADALAGADAGDARLALFGATGSTNINELRAPKPSTAGVWEWKTVSITLSSTQNELFYRLYLNRNAIMAGSPQTKYAGVTLVRGTVAHPSPLTTIPTGMSFIGTANNSFQIQSSGLPTRVGVQMRAEGVGGTMRMNAMPNPLVKNNATYWSSFASPHFTISGGSRVTGENAPLATTAYERVFTVASGWISSDTGGVYFAPSGSENGLPVSPGQTIRCLIYGKVQAADRTPAQISVRVRYTQANAAYLSETNVGTAQLNPVTGTWYLLTGTNVVPANAAFAQVMLSFLANSGSQVGETITLRVTGALVASDSTGTDYFDGDSPGSAWVGTAHASKSVAGTNYQAVVAATPNLVSRWKLDETSGTTATDDIGSRNGTYSGGATINQTPLTPGAGRSVTFDGVDDDVTVTYNSALNPTQFTYEAWIVWTGGGAFPAIVASESGGGTWKGSGLWTLNDGTNRVALHVHDGSATSHQIVSPNNAISLGGRYHIVGTYDGTTATLYVNGKSVVSSALTYSVNTTASLQIGFGNNLSRFAGTIDEVALYSRALTAAEVAMHFDAAGEFAQAVDATTRASTLARSIAIDYADGLDEDFNWLPNPAARNAGSFYGWGAWAGTGAVQTSYARAAGTGPSGGPPDAARWVGTLGSTTASLILTNSTSDSASGTTAPSVLRANGWRRVRPGDQYTVGCWMRRDDANVTSFGFTAYYRRDDGLWVALTDSPTKVNAPTLGQWYWVEHTFTVPAGGAWAMFWPKWVATNGAALDVYVTGLIDSTKVATFNGGAGYFDGASPSARWTGTANASASARPTIARIATGSRAISDASNASTQSLGRLFIGNRPLSDSVDGNTQVLTRLFAGNRSFSDTAHAIDSLIKLRSYGIQTFATLTPYQALAAIAAYSSRSSLSTYLGLSEVDPHETMVGL